MDTEVALAEWLRRVPAKYMGFPRESSNLSGDVLFYPVFIELTPHHIGTSPPCLGAVLERCFLFYIFLYHFNFLI